MRARALGQAPFRLSEAVRRCYRLAQGEGLAWDGCAWTTETASWETNAAAGRAWALQACLDVRERDTRQKLALMLVPWRTGEAAMRLRERGQLPCRIIAAVNAHRK